MKDIIKQNSLLRVIFAILAFGGAFSYSETNFSIIIDKYAQLW